MKPFSEGGQKTKCQHIGLHLIPPKLLFKNPPECSNIQPFFNMLFKSSI